MPTVMPMQARTPRGRWEGALVGALCLALQMPGVAHAAEKKAPAADLDEDSDTGDGDPRDGSPSASDAARAPAAKDGGNAAGPAAASQVSALPFYAGLSAELLGGASAIPSPLVANRAIWDRYVGVRVGWRRTVWKLQLGVEGAWRSTFLAYAGSRPIWFDALLQRASGHFPHQVIRWQNQATGVGTVGWKYERMGFFVEPTLQLGMGASFRQVAVHLDQLGPYNRSLLTLGPLVGASFIMGIAPLFWRWDAIASSEFGPPPFTARYHTLQFNMSLGVRL